MDKAKAGQAQCTVMLAIGTANPTHCVPQDVYADWQNILASAVPELTATAARKVIAEWGLPTSNVTHLIFYTNSGAHMPGADLRLASLLDLRTFVQRTMMYLNRRSSGSAALRVAKDVAKNNPGAHVLVACADLSLIGFRSPHQDHFDTLVMQALFGDGAGAVIVGAGWAVIVGAGCENNGSGERSGVEHPLFEMLSASQTVIPGSEKDAAGQLGEDGLVFCPSPKMPALVRQHVEQALVEAFRPLGFINGGWNDLRGGLGGCWRYPLLQLRLHHNRSCGARVGVEDRGIHNDHDTLGAVCVILRPVSWRRLPEEEDGVMED
ncbi:hypothetical protein PR202_gb13317 [Eleusine coracana subsp. coracana]|uniref:Chalcone synthase n=1 Tax=Eleusine coracana subsp. coracana TaxID=191504 RepID=A0AAV5ETG0_ELECO|nr:hypothetical protein PR202_gb13317 [Eleusine coracana subsp. coracana]